MKYKLLVATAAVIALAAGMAPSAQANLLVEASIDGSGLSTICSTVSGGSCAATLVSNGLSFILSGASSNSPGTPAIAGLLSATVQLTNTDPTAHLIRLVADDTGFTQPLGGILTSSIGTTTQVAGAGNSMAFRSCIDDANGQDSCPGTLATAALHPAITAVGSSSAFNTIAVAGLTAPFSIGEEYIVNLSPGSTINFSASSRLEPVSANEPAGLAVLVVGLIGTSLAIRRRQRAQPENNCALA